MILLITLRYYNINVILYKKKVNILNYICINKKRIYQIVYKYK